MGNITFQISSNISLCTEFVYMHHVPAATVEYSNGTLKEIIPNRSSMFFVLIKFSKFLWKKS